MQRIDVAKAIEEGTPMGELLHWLDLAFANDKTRTEVLIIIGDNNIDAAEEMLKGFSWALTHLPNEKKHYCCLCSVFPDGRRGQLYSATATTGTRAIFAAMAKHGGWA